MLEPHITELAKTHLTDNQLRVFLLHHRQGLSFRDIARRHDLARTTITDRYDGACRRLRAQGVKFTPDGNPYLEDVA